MISDVEMNEVSISEALSKDAIKYNSYDGSADKIIGNQVLTDRRRRVEERLEWKIIQEAMGFYDDERP